MGEDHDEGGDENGEDQDYGAPEPVAPFAVDAEDAQEEEADRYSGEGYREEECGLPYYVPECRSRDLFRGPLEIVQMSAETFADHHAVECHPDCGDCL